MHNESFFPPEATTTLAQQHHRPFHDDDDDRNDALLFSSLVSVEGDIGDTSSSSSNATSSNCNSKVEEEADEEELASSTDVEDDIEFLLPSGEYEKAFSGAPPCPELTESLVAQQMTNLSVKDREEVYFDLHGVSGAIDEEPAFLNRKLDELQYELELVDANEKKAYLMALAANPAYVRNTNLRLRFLRADRFEAKLAAQRYVYHFDTKWKLFGADKLGRDIIQEDLDNETLDALYCGFNQLIPQRDSAGRAIFVYVSNGYQQSYSNRAVMRRYFYNSMLVTDDVETQRKGVVGVMYAIGGNLDGKTPSTDEGSSRASNSGAASRKIEQGGKAWKLFGPMCRAAPMRIVGLHCCYDNLTWLPVVSTIRVAADLFSRLRFRAHRGSHTDCMYKLQTFGIPTGIFPVDKNGWVLSEKYHVFLEKRRELENQWKGQSLDEIQGRIFVPCARDVLLGRGQGFFNHVGNVRYRSIIEDLKDEYDNSEKRGVKKQIAHEVVRMVYLAGGRFLKYDGGGWVVVEENVARLKVGHSFRAERVRSSTSRTESSNTANTTKHKSTTRAGDGSGVFKNDDEPLRLKRTRAA